MVSKMEKRSKVIALVKETTQLGQERGLVDRAKATKKVSEKTQRSYDKTASTRIDLNQQDCGRLMDGVSARSWHTIKASLLHVISQRYMEARKTCDHLQKTGDWDGAGKQAVIARRAIIAFDKVQESERPEPTKKRATKRGTLPKSDDWQRRAYNAATPTQQPAVALIWATGARPEEVERGVSVERLTHNESGKEYLAVTISGAKITKTSGQEQRTIVIDLDSDAGKVLSDHMGEKDEVIIRRGAKRLNKDFTAIRERTGLKVSPYSMRHQMSANLKPEFGVDGAKKVAQAMGHATTRSQGRYGSAQQAQSGKTGVFKVQASRPVKETRSGPKHSGPEAGSSFSNRPG